MFSSQRHISTAILTAVVVSGSSACAAQGPCYRYPAPRASVDSRAYDHGYSQGRRDGEHDARRRRSPDYTRHDDYRDADDGYRGGNRQAYRDLYRQGFVAGYNDGFNQYSYGAAGSYRRYPRYPPNATYPTGYSSRAAENGWRDGYEQGRSDGRDRDRYDPVRASRYRSGDRGYDRRDGTLSDYKREYRAAFQRGYDRGYRESRY
jgi:hypothetical protein